MEPETKYDEHLRFLVKQEMAARAELQGYRDAKQFSYLMQYSKERFEQDRYVTGFQDGKTILSLEKAS